MQTARRPKLCDSKLLKLKSKSRVDLILVAIKLIIQPRGINIGLSPIVPLDNS
jgi:hypothetical protein